MPTTIEEGRIGVLLVVAPLLFALALPSVARAQAHHASVAARAQTQAPATRWATDAPLREGMARIRIAVGALQHAEHGHLDAHQRVELSRGILRDIDFIVSHCKLTPRADAALHPTLGTLAQGAQALQATPPDLSAIARMRGALGDYDRHFAAAP